MSYFEEMAGNSGGSSGEIRIDVQRLREEFYRSLNDQVRVDDRHRMDLQEIDDRLSGRLDEVMKTLEGIRLMVENWTGAARAIKWAAGIIAGSAVTYVARHFH